MKEELDLKCTRKLLATAEEEDGTSYVCLYEFNFPWNCYAFSTTKFYVVIRRVMDWDSACWDHFHNDLWSAMKDFGREANRKVRYGRSRKLEKVYGKVKYEEDWKYSRYELSLDYRHPDERPLSMMNDPDREDYHYCRSATNGDYGPSNPWDAPGMSVSDFLPGVY